MNVVEVFALRGYKKMRFLFDRYVGMTPTHGKYLVFNRDGMCNGIINTGCYGDVHCGLIDQALDYVEIVTKLGGVNKASKVLHKCYGDRSLARYYADCSLQQLESAINFVDNVAKVRKKLNESKEDKTNKLQRLPI